MKKHNLFFLPTLGFVSLVFLQSPDIVLAEDSADNNVILEEIVVTANKREESLQNVPIAIAAISGQKLEESATGSVIDVARLVPGIHFQERQDQRTASFGIRGISTPQTATGAEPSAAIMLDGEAFARSTAFHNDLIDIERVEILRGPQGTLFGKNTSVGAIHVVSVRPRLDDNTKELTLSFAEDNEFMVKVAANIAKNNTAWRINGFYKEADGWIPNVRSGQPNGGESDRFGIRSQLLHQFSENTELLWRLEYSEQNYGAGNRVWIELDDPTNQIHVVSQTPFGPENDRTSQIGGRNYGELKNFGTSIEVNHSLGEYALTYQGSYRDFDLFTNEDQSAVAVNLFPNYFAGPTTSKTTQHELRLTSPLGGAIDYVVGAYAYYEDTFRNEIIDSCVGDPGLNNSVIDPATFEITECPNTLAYGFLNSAQNTGPGNDGYFVAGVNSTTIEKTNVALFGQANWHLSDSLTAILGARVLRENQDFQLTNTINRGIANYTRSVDDSDILVKVGLQFNISDDAMIFATYSTGYKGVAWFNTPGFTDGDVADDNYPTAPEESSQIELGLRSDWLDDRFRLNINVFQLNIEGYQDRVFSIDPATGVEIRRLINAGDVTSQGVEMDGTAIFSDNFQVSFAVNFLDATYESDIFVGCPAAFLDAQLSTECVALVPGGAANRFNLNGRTTSNAPDVQYNLSGRYAMDLDGGYSAYARLDYRWKDDETSEPSGVSRLVKQSHGIADLYVGLTSPDRQFSLDVYVKNLFDKAYYSHHSSSDGFFASIISPDSLSGSVPRDFRRYMGTSLRWQF